MVVQLTTPTVATLQAQEETEIHETEKQQLGA
jgi:hypothetical protein